MAISHPYSEVIEEGLDRQNIAILTKRYMAVNEDRLERMRGALNDRHQLFMDVLPLLFHTNHPMMPGFVSRQTPARVSHFKPSKRDVLVGKMVAKSFTLSFDPSQDDDIYGLYIMGSVGTIAQSERSDLDIWVCHRPNLNQQQLKELEKKCQKISAWAQQSRLEVHFFLMNHDAFKEKQFSALDEESSGSAQQQLLLDEFYRSAIFVAGRTPVWWLVPPTEEENFREYTNTLLYKRFIPNDSVIDFGGMAEIPAGEFLGAGVWQLYKGIESPYKSVLKLLLLEAYVADYPNITPLSLTFKQRIFEGETNINALDSYVLVYERIEQYLEQKEQFDRLELVRRCFYFKVNKALSRPPVKHAKSWQRLLLENLTRAWGWSDELIHFLDSRGQWKAADVIEEYRNLVRELNHSYRLLLAFANDTSKSERTISSSELVVLGRKLQAAFERRPGKIDLVNPGISADLSESILILKQLKSESAREMLWCAFSKEGGTISEDEGELVKSSGNLVELLLWCYVNEVLTQTTYVSIEGQTLSDIEIRRLLSCFQDWLPLPLQDVTHSAFEQVSSPRDVLFLLNVGKNAEPDLAEKGYQRMSDRADALSYGGFEENLIVSVDLVVRNNWNEISIRRFDQDNALLAAITEYLQFALPGTHQQLPDITVSCIDNAHTNTISRRVQDWLQQITQCFFSGQGSQHKRFIFHLADTYHCLQFRNMRPTIATFHSENVLIDHLEQEQQQYSRIALDSHMFRAHPLKVICNQMRPNCINVFFRRFDIGIEIYLVDERGSILHSVFRGRRRYNPLKPLYLFLRAVLYRQAQANEDMLGDFGVFPVNFYELLKTTEGAFTCESRKIVPEPSERAKMEVKASAHLGPNRELRYNYYCDGQEFSYQEFEQQLELVVSQFILSRRSQIDHYPVYLSDVDLSQVADIVSPNGQLQTVHYIRIKNRLESMLNRTIGILLDA